MTQKPQSDVSELPPAQSEALVETVARAICPYYGAMRCTCIELGHAPRCTDVLDMARAALSVLPQHPALMECVEALKFYADRANYRQAVPATDLIWVWEDHGQKARDALAVLSRLQAQGGINV